MDRRQPPPAPGSPRTAGYLLGFALSGFFDGILLHQILQWHHLLSSLKDGRFADLRVQILADGLFHALMYLIALIGLWLLVRRRQALLLPEGSRQLMAALLIGFGCWHVTDALLSHWLLGIHRIRLAPPGPLFWDLLWLGIFGLLPILIGAWLRRPRPRRTDEERRGGLRSANLPLLFLTVTGAALIALLDPFQRAGNPNHVTLVLRPDATPTQLLAALPALDGRIVASAGHGTVWVVALPQHAERWQLYRHGALLVAGAGSAAGCVGWVR